MGSALGSLFLVLEKNMRGLFSSCALFVILCSVEVQGQTRGLQGDEVPPQYPIIDVHIPEGEFSRTRQHVIAEEEEEISEELNQLHNRMVAKSAMVARTIKSLQNRLQTLPQTMTSMKTHALR